MLLTNFALTAVIAAQHHRPVGHEASSAHVRTTEPLARLHCLHGKVLSHGFGDGINVLSGLETLLRQKLNLGASVAG
jgi:hypothetical protein